MSPLEPGLEILPGLTLLRPLGRGGMGEASLARDAERGEDVVAKVVPADASAEKVALLRREARLVRKLAHPRIVPVHAFRSGERGSAVTLRYMPGGDAGRKRGAPPLEVVRLGRDVAEALSTCTASASSTATSSRRTSSSTGRAARASRTSASRPWPGAPGGDRPSGGRIALEPQPAADRGRAGPARGRPLRARLAALRAALRATAFPARGERRGDPNAPAPSRGLALPGARRASGPGREPAREIAEGPAAVGRGGARGAPGDRGAAPWARTGAPRTPRAAAATAPSEPAPVMPAELRDRASRQGSRPPRAGLSAGQVTLLAALGVAVVVAVAWLPRWAQAPAAPTLTPTAEAPKPARADSAPPEATASAPPEALPPAPEPRSPVVDPRPDRPVVASAPPDPGPTRRARCRLPLPLPIAWRKPPPWPATAMRRGPSRRRKSGPPPSPSTRRPSG